eukprot:3773390-Ditylum_brightwellii.AAC.1
MRRKPGNVREGRICQLAELSGCTVDIRVLNTTYDDFIVFEITVSFLGTFGVSIPEQVPVAAQQ